MFFPQKPGVHAVNSGIKNLKLAVLNVSVVVLAEVHNPTILHPAFLVAQEIVPSDWELADLPVCTPAISVVKFTNNILLTAEIPKFQVVDNSPTPATPIPGLAVRYIEKLPHVRYTAVGINISGYVQCPQPEAFLLDRFIKHGPWADAKLKPDTLGVQLTYPVEQGKLNLKCEPGTVHKTQGKTELPVLLINANYHIGLAAERALAEAKSAIELLPQRLAHFDEITQIVFGLEK